MTAPHGDNGRQRRAIDERQHDDRVEDAEIARVRPLLGGERAADADQPDVGPLGADRREHVEQHVDALARNGAADVQQLDPPPRTREPRRLQRRPPRRLRASRPCSAPFGIDRQLRSRGNAGQPRPAPSRVASLSQATCAACAAPRGSAATSSETAPNAARRPARGSSGTRRRRGTSRACASAGSVVHQVRVTVIDDVIHVEAASDGARRPRVVPLPRHDAIER